MHASIVWSVLAFMLALVLTRAHTRTEIVEDGPDRKWVLIVQLSSATLITQIDRLN